MRPLTSLLRYNQTTRMLRQKLAEKLTAAQTAAERQRLLAQNRGLADVLLAAELQEACLQAFSAEPARTGKIAAALETLYHYRPDEQIRAYLFWTAGIHKLTGGRLEEAIEELDRAARLFKELDQPHRAAQTAVAKLIPLALLGRYDEAIRTGRRVIPVLEKADDHLSAGKIEKNLGNIVARRGQEKEAEKYYLSAIRRFQRADDARELAMCENSLANTYAELNDFRRAEKFYRRALRRAEKNEMRLTVAEIEASIGNLAVFRGQFDRALRFLELSRQKFEALEMPHQNAVAELEIADVYLELNLPEEALAIYQKTAGRLAELKMRGEEARARANFGRAAALLKRDRLAGKELEKAARLYLAEKNKTGAAAVKLIQARIALDAENPERSRKLTAEAEKLLGPDGNPRYLLTAGWLTGESWRKLGNWKKARAVLERVHAEAARQEQGNIAQHARNSLGRLALQTGDPAEAERHFITAVEIVENLRDPLPAEHFRMAFLADKLAPYENLAGIYLAAGDPERAFYWIERSRARSLAESLEVRRSATTGKRDENVRKLDVRLADLREELNWFYSRLKRIENDPARSALLQREAGKRERQIADAMRRIESLTRPAARSASDRDAGRKSGTDTLPAAAAEDFLADLRRSLGQERRALIEFVNLDGRFSAFVVTDEKIEYIADLATEDEVLGLLEGLRFQFGVWRYGSENLERFSPQLKKRADTYLERLGEKLLAPVESILGDRDPVIVPAGILHYVPFPALRRPGGGYLVETKEVALAPAARVWKILSARKKRSLESALLIGFADDQAPLVNREIKLLEKLFTRAKTYTGRRASFASYTKNAGDFDILHLACHGQFRPDNPLFSSLHLADGFVTVGDICAEKLTAGLVTLSACETGLHQIFPGDEILGLARGFLSAGAESLVLSLWTVNDRATARLMGDFYRYLREGDQPAGALRRAQCNFIERKAHPYFWSPFVIIGK